MFEAENRSSDNTVVPAVNSLSYITPHLMQSVICILSNMA